MAGRVAGRLQQLRLELAGEEFVGIALVDQQRQALRASAISSQASHAFHASRSSPRYAANAFSPHGTCDGATIGENADTLR